jgi:hypothetical protein
VALSGLGMFLIVFGLQQGQAGHWQPWVWAMIVAGLGFMSVFVYWQSINAGEPLIPLGIFADRDFSLCNAGVAVTAFAMTAVMLPLPFFLHAGCGLSPTRSALVIAPMAVANGVLAPFVGVIVDRYDPRPVLGFGFALMAVGLTWLSFEMAPATPIWRLLLPFGVIGVGSAFVWSPLTATATRNLHPDLAGAGSAVYNAVRQLGAVLGSASMAAFMAWRISARMQSPAPAAEDNPDVQLPEFLREPFSAAMAESVLLPAFITLFGVLAALFLVGYRPPQRGELPDGGDYDDYAEDYDDDEYVEFLLVREPEVTPAPTSFAHNGFRVGPAPQRAHRYRPDPDEDPTGYGRHSSGA